MFVAVSQMCAVPTESRKGHQTPQKTELQANVDARNSGPLKEQRVFSITEPFLQFHVGHVCIVFFGFFVCLRKGLPI